MLWCNNPMPKRRTDGAAPPASKKIPTPDRLTVAQRSAKRAQLLVARMMKEMDRGLRDPAYLASEEWERLFGAKQSMVVNLQKLVATLSDLPGEVNATDSAETPMIAPITVQEMEMLKAWLTQGKTEKN